MTDVLYRWPDSAKFGKAIPKTKFYEHASVSTAVRGRFVAEVDRITWAYKLAESTINLAGTTEVPEIQAFVIAAKAADVDNAVLAAIDKAIKQPVIFEVATAQGTRMTATLKKSTLRGRYYTTEWSRADLRLPLPPSISLSNLYAALLAPLLPTSIRPGERMTDIADRLAAISRLERKVASLERKLRSESQLNRKVELRRTLTAQQAKFADLTNATTASTMTKTN